MDPQSSLPCAILSHIQCVLMSSKKGFVRMETISVASSLALQTVESITADEARLDDPPSPSLEADQEHPSWLSQLQLYDRAFALAQEGITGPALATALTAFNATLCPPVDTLGVQLAIETGELEVQTHAATPQPTLDQAIATQDVQALYACLPQLVELHTVSPLSYALKKSEIKAAF